MTLEYKMHQKVPFWVAVGFRRSDDLICHAVNLSQDRIFPPSWLGNGTLLLTYFNFPFLHGEFNIVVTLLNEYKFHVYHSVDSAGLTILSAKKME